MKLPLRPIAVLLVIAVVGAYAYNRFSAEEEPGFLTGYVEGDALYFAAPVSGALLHLDVAAGQRVEAGASLFAVDPGPITAQQQQAEAGIVAADARAADSRAGQRPEELAVVAAQRDAARAKREEAQTELERVTALVARGSLPSMRRDQAETTLEVAEATFQQLSRQFESDQLGARQWQIAAADADAAKARAASDEIARRISQLTPKTPVGGRIEDSFYQPGEWVPANQPVLALLPDNAVKLRFYVPETSLPLYAPGTDISFSCDSCAPASQAHITYVSPRAEFTPPVIYSRGSREKLVYLVEALPADPAGLAPGQPVDITPLEG